MMKNLKQKWEAYLENETLKRELVEDLKVAFAVAIAIACFLTFLLSVGYTGSGNSPHPPENPVFDLGTGVAASAQAPPLPFSRHDHTCVSCSSRKEGL